MIYKWIKVICNESMLRKRQNRMKDQLSIMWQPHPLSWYHIADALLNMTNSYSYIILYNYSLQDGYILTLDKDSYLFFFSLKIGEINAFIGQII